MILDDLRRATRAIHGELESRLPLGRPDLTREDYRELVRRFHGFIVPLEREIVSCPGVGGPEFDYRERLKQPALEADLAALDLSDRAKLADAADLPRLETVEDVYGCLYVIEGSTLGGQVISRSLREHLDIHPENGGAYFSGYGSQTGVRWKEFLARLAEVAERGGADQEAITQSAVATFHALDRWLVPETQSPSPQA